MKTTFSNFINLYEQDDIKNRVQTVENDTKKLLAALESIMEESSYRRIKETLETSLKKTKQALLVNGLYSMD